MKYSATEKAIFLKRPNRFIAHVLLNNKEEIVHVKNTGRCREILKEGTEVILEKATNPKRKTRYSLIAAYKNELLINIDSQVPNQVAYEAMEDGLLPFLSKPIILRREVSFGNSRFDLYFETGKNKGFIEVKGVTLENNGQTLFPDAPTSRGARHVQEMAKAVEQGYLGYILFLIQMKGVKNFTPNKQMDPDFDRALKEANKKGVKLLAYDCYVTEDSIKLGDQVPILL